MNNTQELNMLALEVAKGIEGAYEKLHKKIDKPLFHHAFKMCNDKSIVEDKHQDFLIKAYEMCFIFAEKHASKASTKYMALVYTACTNLMLNEIEYQKREKRAKFSEASLDADTNDGGSDDKLKTLGDSVTDMGQLDTSTIAIGNVTKEFIEDLMDEYKQTASLRDYEIIQALTQEQDNLEVAHIVNQHARSPKPIEQVSYGKNERKTVSRARKSFKEFLESKEIFV